MCCIDRALSHLLLLLPERYTLGPHTDIMSVLLSLSSVLGLSCDAAAYVRKFMERPLQDAGFEQIEFLEVLT